MNEYEPWKEFGMTETEYFKMRYVEARGHVSQLKNALVQVGVFLVARNTGPKMRKMIDDALAIGD